MRYLTIGATRWTPQTTIGVHAIPLWLVIWTSQRSVAFGLSRRGFWLQQSARKSECTDDDA